MTDPFFKTASDPTGHALAYVRDSAEGLEMTLIVSGHGCVDTASLSMTSGPSEEERNNARKAFNEMTEAELIDMAVKFRSTISETLTPPEDADEAIE